jgi:hypothetical protein
VAEPRLIREYLADLDARLPADLVEELADGLDETYCHHLAAGLDTHAAARAALAEFGDPATIAAAFTRTAPARRAALVLLRAGPVVGGCWAVALISARAWDWPVPTAVPLVLAAALVASIVLLLMAAFCDRYRTSRRAGVAALLALVALDVALPGLLVPSGLLRGWPLIVASTLSLVRAGHTTRALRRIRTGRVP